MRLLIHAIPLALVIVARSGAIHGVNPQALRLLGWSPQEIEGMHVTDLLQVSQVEFPLPEEFRISSFETRLATRDMRSIFVAVTISELDDASDVWLVSLQDISERKQLEQMKRDFVAMVSHDLRTPLTTMQLVHEFVEEEARQKLSDLANKELAVVRSNINRLIALINNLLDIEKLPLPHRG
jgi:PAS domain S-box-containing protein